MRPREIRRLVVAARVRSAMAEADLHESDVAERLGVPDYAISNVVTGRRQSLALREAIARVCLCRSRDLWPLLCPIEGPAMFANLTATERIRLAMDLSGHDVDTLAQVVGLAPSALRRLVGDMDWSAAAWSPRARQSIANALHWPVEVLWPDEAETLRRCG